MHLTDMPKAPRGHTEDVKPAWADAALLAADGDYGKAYSQYIILAFRSTGKLALGCDARDLLAYYWYQLHPATGVVAEAMAVLQATADPTLRRIALMDVPPDGLLELGGRLRVDLQGGRWTLVMQLAEAVQTVIDSASAAKESETA